MVPLTESALAFVLFPLVFLAPGYLGCRALGLPRGLLESFTLGSLLHFGLLLLFISLGLPLRLEWLLPALTVLCLILGLAAGRQASIVFPDKVGPGGSGPLHASSWLCALAFGFASVFILLRISFEPLSGLDHSFRYDFLGWQMQRLGNLDFYPVSAPQDHRSYGWCDGFPPLVALYHMWAYLLAGPKSFWAPLPRIFLETIVLCWGLARLAIPCQGQRFSFETLAVVASCPVLLWVMMMGQETGLISIGVIGMLLAFRSRLSASWKPWLALGLSAALAACSREYGLAWIGFGGVCLALARPGPKAWIAFLLGALLPCLPWYLRVWMKTGNPLFPHTLAGTFPGHPVYEEMNALVAPFFNPWNRPAAFLEWLSVVGPLLAVPVILLLAGFLRPKNCLRTEPTLLSAIGLSAMLWLVSIPYTAGGWTYSLRVLAPALVLASVAAGDFIASLPGVGRTVASVMLLSFALVLGPRAWTLPQDPSPAYSDLCALKWRDWDQRLRLMYSNSYWRARIKEAPGRHFLVDDAAFQSHLIRQGASTLSLFSPEVSHLFEDSRSLDIQLEALRRNGVRYLVLSDFNPFSETRAQKHRFFSEIQRRYTPNEVLILALVYDLEHLRVAAGPAQG